MEHASDNHFIEETDDMLVESIRAGDEDAAARLILRHYDAVFRYAVWHTKTRETAEDLTQETFLRAMKNLRRYRKCGQFKAWLFRIARNLCVDESRAASGRHEIAVDEMPEIAAEDDVFFQSECRRDAEKLMQNLSKAQREAVLLYFFADMSYGEIGAVLKIPPRTAQSRVRYAIETMRKSEGIKQ